MSRMPLHLMQHPDELVVARLAPGEEPSWDVGGGVFCSVTRTTHETSIICDAHLVPDDVRSEGPYVPFEVAGPLDFELVGVMHEILSPVVASRISVLSMSTFDTDWALVPVDRADEAAGAWRKAGFIVTPTSLSAWQPPTEDA